MCRWLLLVAEHDRRGAHETWGFPAVPSPARGSCKGLRLRNREAGVEAMPGALLALGRGERFDRELAVAGLLARAVRAGP